MRKPKFSAPCKKIHFMQQNKNKTTTHSFLITRLISKTLLLSHEIHVFLGVVNQHYQKRVSPVYRSNICIVSYIEIRSESFRKAIDIEQAVVPLKQAAAGNRPYLHQYPTSEAHPGLILKRRSSAFQRYLPLFDSTSVRGCGATRSWRKGTSVSIVFPIPYKRSTWPVHQDQSEAC